MLHFDFQITTTGIGWVGWFHEREEALDFAVGGLGGEAVDLPLCVAGGGQAVRVRRRGEGKIPDVHADDGEFQRLPGAFLLRDVQPFPYPP